MNFGNERFYQPLKTSLDKSIARTTSLQQDPHWATKSRIGSQPYSLTPQQADYIKKSTFVPLDKNLVPTGNVQRIRGKQFKVIDYQVTAGQPISEQIFRASFSPQRRKQQIVYELTNKPEIKNISSLAHIRTVSPANVAPTRILSSSPIPRNSSLSAGRTLTSMPRSIYYCKGCNISPRPVASVPRPSYLQNSVKSNISSSPSSIPHFKKAKSNNSNYKYNLFSSFDEFVNSKCSTFGDNQFIAKPLNNYQTWS